MIASLIVVFREVLEAGLIVGIVLAATRGVPERGRWIAGGIASGVFGAVLLASFAGLPVGGIRGQRAGTFQCLHPGVAVVMLSWHVLWMARHGREMAQQMRAADRRWLWDRNHCWHWLWWSPWRYCVRARKLCCSFMELPQRRRGAASLAAGGAMGIAAGAAVSWLLYRGLLVIPVRHLFSITGVLIAFWRLAWPVRQRRSWPERT